MHSYVHEVRSICPVPSRCVWTHYNAHTTTNCLMVNFSELELQWELKAWVALSETLSQSENTKCARDTAWSTGLAWMRSRRLSHQHPQNENSTCSLPKSCLSVLLHYYLHSCCCHYYYVITQRRSASTVSPRPFQLTCSLSPALCQPHVRSDPLTSLHFSLFSLLLCRPLLSGMTPKPSIAMQGRLDPR